MRAFWGAYRFMAPLLGAVAPAAGVFTSPHERELWNERLGRVSLPGGCHAWVHAASMGEAAAVAPLLRELSRAQPGARYWLTSTTRTGRERLAACGPPVSLAPIDSPQATRRFLSGVQPERVFLIETELWPHWLLRARALGLPVAIVSARLSERSVRRYRSLGPGMRGLVGGLSAVLCQGEDDERRWLEIGAEPGRTCVVGNLKSDGLPQPAPSRAEARALMGLDPERPLLVLGSLRPGEVRPLARAWCGLPESLRNHWQVVAVPRHPRAFEELRTEAAEGGVGSGGGTTAGAGWQWDDRTGVLVDWYRAADVAFVGGSLVQLGGHNPLEPAACGAAVLMGPHAASQRDYVRALAAARGIVIAGAGAPLLEALRELLGDPAERARCAAAAFAVARAQMGAAERAVRALVDRGLWPA
jgi:3-deoxy-D-manno-octulosonic-acid transferase